MEVLGCLALATTKHRVRSTRGTAEINLGEIAFGLLFIFFYGALFFETMSIQQAWAVSFGFQELLARKITTFTRNMSVGEKTRGKWPANFTSKQSLGIPVSSNGSLIGKVLPSKSSIIDHHKSETIGFSVN